MSRQVFLAFASGALTFDCRPCGRCCRGRGYGVGGGELAATPPLVALSPFAARRADDGLVSFFTYADGCRQLDDDGGCALHASGGRLAKPLVCRLYPFSRLVSLDDVWMLLPDAACPWTAAPSADDAASGHDAVLADLRPALAALAPRALPTKTHLSPARRLALETTLRDAVPCDASPEAALVAIAARQVELIGPVWERPELDLWLDLLRCAGEPAPLSPAVARLFVAALPLLRLHAYAHLPLGAVPAALAAFELWLRALGELDDRDGRRRSSIATGEDVLHLFAHAVPLVTVMAMATRPARELPLGEVSMLRQMTHACPEAAERSLGELVASYLRHDRMGALPLVAELGRTLGTVI